MLRATTAYTFPTAQLPKVVRSSSALSISTWKCASRHNRVHSFMSHLASWLRTRRFSEPTFRPSGASNHRKITVFRDFPIFSRICIFFLLTLSLLIFSLLIFLFSLPLPCSAFHRPLSRSVPFPSGPSGPWGPWGPWGQGRVNECLLFSGLLLRTPLCDCWCPNLPESLPGQCVDPSQCRIEC